MKVISPETGSSVEIVLGPGGHGEHFLATVADTTPGGLILGSFETADQATLPELNTPLKVRFHQRDAGYEFDSVLLAKKEAPFKLAYVARPVTLLRRQLRAYLRVDCEIPVSIVRRDDQRRNIFSGTVLNISGGGMLVSLMTTIPPDVVVEPKFELGPGGRAIQNVTARVLSIRQGEAGAKLHILQFEGIDDEQRTAIIRHTFALQQKAKKARDGEEPA